MEHTTVAALVVSLLEQAGIQRVHALPGEENLAVNAALAASDMTTVVARHEQQAAFAAAADGRLNPWPGACLATLGPGATNLFTGLAHAHLGGWPMVAITGQKPAIDNTEGSFQVLDVVSSARPLVKDSIRLDDEHTTAGVVEQALRVAVNGRPGPVLIELPEDVAVRTCRNDGLRQPIRPVRFGPLAETLRSAADAINTADRPVLLASEHANRRAPALSLRSFAEATGLGVVITQLGMGAIPADHSLAIGTLGIHRPDHSHLGVVDADLVIAVGYDPVEHPPLAWNRNDVDIVHVAPWPARVERGYRPVVDLVGPIANTLDALAPLIRRRSPTDASSRKRVVDDVLADEFRAAEESPSHTPTPLDVVRRVQSVVGDSDTVALDNGLYKVWFARHWKANRTQQLLCDNALATMGAGFATAIAAALQQPDGRVIAVCGDGGGLMNIQDLGMVDQLGVDLTMVILRNDSYGFIGWHQDEEQLRRDNVALKNPDFVALAEAFGATAERVRSADELESALRASWHSTGLHVIECPLDDTNNDALEVGDEVAIGRFRRQLG